MDWPTILTLGGTVIATGIGLLAVLVPGQRDLRREVSGVRDRISKLEGLLEGLRDAIRDRTPHA